MKRSFRYIKCVGGGAGYRMVHISHAPGKDSGRKYIKELIMFAPVWAGSEIFIFSFLARLLFSAITGIAFDIRNTGSFKL